MKGKFADRELWRFSLKICGDVTGLRNVITNGRDLEKLGNLIRRLFKFIVMLCAESLLPISELLNYY